MLHTKFRENRPAGSGEEDFLKGFYHIWAWRPSWSGDPDDPDHEYPISSPMSLRLSCAKMTDKHAAEY